jgi:hypothetical protein
MTSGRRRGRAACGEAAKGAAPARQTPSHHPLKGERASERSTHTGHGGGPVAPRRGWTIAQLRHPVRHSLLAFAAARPVEEELD